MQLGCQRIPIFRLFSKSIEILQIKNIKTNFQNQNTKINRKKFYLFIRLTNTTKHPPVEIY
jgi:hypothetical protein